MIPFISPGKKTILNKILVTIQGRTLILTYQIKRGLERKDTGRANYIQILPSAELARYNLKGLTPEMFCVNISDMVNIRGLYSGQVENERQQAVAKWALNYDEFLQLRSSVATQLNHQQLVNLLASTPGYIHESDGQYIEFEERVVPHETGENATYSGYRLTLMTEEIEGDISTRAYYYLDTCNSEGWQETLPPPQAYEPIQIALANRIQSIRNAGVRLTTVSDETDYAIRADQESD
jgi:hypothetical protein